MASKFLYDTTEQGVPDKPRKKAHFLITIALQSLSLLWIAPVVAVLVLNFHGWIIGASLACGIRGCNVGYGDSNELQRFSDQDQNIQSAFQLVAKAVEIWFGVIAGSLVYDVTMHLFSTRDGLPLSYLSLPLSLSPGTLLETSFWTNTRPTRSESWTKWSKWIPGLFALFIVVMLIVSTLMGPATAVLLIPTLGWKTVPQDRTLALSRINSADGPSAKNTLLLNECSASQIAEGLYSCSPSRPVLDLLFQNTVVNKDGAPPVMTYANLPYLINTTDLTGLTLYAPNGHALDALSNDWTDWYMSVSSGPDYEMVSYLDSLTESDWKLMRNARQTQLLRTAPASQALSICQSNTTSIVHVGNDMAVHCYNIPNPDYYNGIRPFETTTPLPISDPESSCQSFGISISADANSSTTMQVDVYSADRAILLNTTTYGCLNGANCDWNSLFAEEPDPAFRNQTINLQVTEYNLTGYPTAYCFTSAFARVPTYSYIPTNPSNPSAASPITMDDSQFGGIDSYVHEDPMILNPNWMLLAWSVDINGTVPHNSSAANILVSTYQKISPFVEGLSSIHNLAVSRSLFFLQYSAVNATSTSLNYTTNPILDRRISVYVWSYGLQSRTSKLAAVFAIFGCLIVLVKFAVGLVIQPDQRSFLDMLVGALGQAPPQDVIGISEMTANDVAKRRVQIGGEKWAKFKFVHLD
uniref:Uncharacterized protein n=1 Tax=Talaromyces marneffei PM1 TaxID=1077442 RepID=A0A093Y158_TALMA